MKPHKHAEMIKAKADGNIIQQRVPGWPWEEMPGDDFTFHDGGEYRIKPAEPEKVYPVSAMTDDEMHYAFHKETTLNRRLHDFANAAIRRAIDDGQAILLQDVIPTVAAELKERRDERDMAIAEAVRKYICINGTPTGLDLKKIISGVK